MNQELEKIVEETIQGELRDKFEELFPKDQEAEDGIRPSKSNRSAALVLYGYFQIALKSALTAYATAILKEVMPVEKEMSYDDGIMGLENIQNKGFNTCRSLIIERLKAKGIKI